MFFLFSSHNGMQCEFQIINFICTECNYFIFAKNQVTHIFLCMHTLIIVKIRLFDKCGTIFRRADMLLLIFQTMF